jgi:hypothetical protein
MGLGFQHMAASDPPARRKGLTTAGATVARIAQPLFRRRGFAGGAIITDWAAIVGAHLASIVSPERLAFDRDKRDQGTLMVRVASAFGPEVQHLSPQIIAKVNVHFGYPAVARLKILPGTMPDTRVKRTPRKPAPPPPTADTLAELQSVEDPELRAALERLAKALKSTADADGPKAVGTKAKNGGDK